MSPRAPVEAAEVLQKGPVLGIDPGSREGAAVLRHPGQPPIWWCAWTKVKDEKFRATYPGGQVTLPDEVDLGLLIAGSCLAKGPVSAVIVEGLIPKDFSSIVIAESTGALIRGLQRGTLPKPACRPLAVDRRRGFRGWRGQVLGLPDKLEADRAEYEAVRWAMGEIAGTDGKRLRWLPNANLTQKEQGAMAEAGAIAAFQILEVAPCP